MTVGELIEDLRKFSPDARVVVTSNQGGVLEYDYDIDFVADDHPVCPRFGNCYTPCVGITLDDEGWDD